MKVLMLVYKHMKAKQTSETAPIDTVVLSPDAQVMRDFRLSLFIVSVTINFLVFIFWLTVQMLAVQG